MSGDDVKQARIENLKKVQADRKQDALSRVYQAAESIQKSGGKINFHTVAKKANVSVSYLYKYPELKQYIASLRSKQSSLPLKSPAKPVSSESHSKIVGRFKERIRQLESENRELRRKNEALAGQVYRVHHLQAQVERQQQTIEDLEKRLKVGEFPNPREAPATSADDPKVISIDKRKQHKSDILESATTELEALGIPLTTTLNKTIKSASEERVIAAIEALKQAMAKVDIPNPGGWLNTAIKEGWTKNEPLPQQTSTHKPSVYTTLKESEEELISPEQLNELLKGLKQ